jgi:hypothetical protein
VDGRKGAGVEDGDSGRARSQLPVYAIMTEAASRVGEVILFVLLNPSESFAGTVTR